MAPRNANKEETKAVVPVGGNSALPAFLQGKNLGSGLQGLDSSDLIIPLVKLLQGTSEQLTTYDDAKSGEFWATGMDIPLGEEFIFTPLLNRKRYMLMPPLYDGQKGVFARADDGKTWNTLGKWPVRFKGIRTPIDWEIKDLDVRRSGLSEFGTAIPDNPDSNPAATLFYDFLALVHNKPMVTTPVLVSLARSAAKKGKDLQSKIGFMPGAPMWSRKFRATRYQDNNPSGDFWNWTFASNGFVDETFFEHASKYREDFSNRNFRGVGDDEQEEETTVDTKEF